MDHQRKRDYQGITEFRTQRLLLVSGSFCDKTKLLYICVKTIKLYTIKILELIQNKAEKLKWQGYSQVYFSHLFRSCFKFQYNKFKLNLDQFEKFFRRCHFCDSPVKCNRLKSKVYPVAFKYGVAKRFNRSVTVLNTFKKLFK